MTYPQVWSNATVGALPVGRLGERTLLNVSRHGACSSGSA